MMCIFKAKSYFNLGKKDNCNFFLIHYVNARRHRDKFPNKVNFVLLLLFIYLQVPKTKIIIVVVVVVLLCKMYNIFVDFTVN